MDYSSAIKKYLENSDLKSILDEFKLEKDSLNSNLTNICCSNDSFLLIYLEPAAAFLALSFNKLCKSTDNKSLFDSFQRLNINAPSIGKFKKFQLNDNGTHILLVYDKSLTVVELPSRWGKHDQYDGGKANLICKSVKFKLNTKLDIIDSIWHRREDDESVICLTNDHNLRFFKSKNPNILYKEYHLETSYTQIDMELKSSKLLSIDMGSMFEYNNQLGYPIYILRSSGQVECVVEYELNKKFTSIGPLTLVPYCMDHEGDQVVSFLCLPSFPNCIVILLTSGIIYHSILIPNARYSLFESGNINEDLIQDSTAILFTYESIKLNEIRDYSSVRFLRDASNSCRYFICHSTGLHSVYLPWLENLQSEFQSQNSFDFNEFDESKLAEIYHLINTKPFIEKPSNNFLIGCTILNDFSKTTPVVIALNNNLKFTCANINQIESEKLKEIEDCQESEDLFTNYISSLLKREANIPIIKSEKANLELSENELNTFANNSIHLIKLEYIEKQKKVLLEFQKKFKILKRQEEFQNEFVKEIDSKLTSLKSNRESFKKKIEQISLKQQNLEKLTENVYAKLLQHGESISDNESKMYQELQVIKTHLKDFQKQINENKSILNRNENVKSEINVKRLEEQEVAQIKYLLQNESQKIKQLAEKVKYLKLSSKIE